MHTKWLATKKSNEDLSAWLHQVEARLQEANEHLRTCHFAGIPHVPHKELWDQLQAKEKEVERTNRRDDKAKTNVQKMKEPL